LKSLEKAVFEIERELLAESRLRTRFEIVAINTLHRLDQTEHKKECEKNRKLPKRVEKAHFRFHKLFAINEKKKTLLCARETKNENFPILILLLLF